MLRGVRHVLIRRKESVLCAKFEGHGVLHPVVVDLEASVLKIPRQTFRTKPGFPLTLRLLSETHPLGGTSTKRVLTRSYDNLSRPDGFILGTPADPDLDHTVSYGFDDAGRYNNVTGAGKPFGYTYTAGDLIASVTGPVHTVTNTWDKPRHTIYSKNNEVDSVTVSQYTYGVNHIGQRETVQTTGTAFGNTNRGWAWGYDSLGQATKAVNAADTALNRAYVFDGIGNRTSATAGSGTTATTIGYTPNALNQYQAINPGTAVNPTYDADGNLRNDAGINALTYGLKYEWDAENRLIAVRKADNTPIATYAYDHLSRRIRKTTTAAAYPYQTASDTTYLYDGWNVVAEYSITNNQWSITQAYTWGLDLSGSMQGAGGVGGLLAVTDSTGTYFPTYDGNGNVSEYLDSIGSVSAHYEYDPFGRSTVAIGAKANDFAHRFSTKPLDTTTGLYYYGYRFYDPNTGRWPSRDPIGEEGGINLYGFCFNNSIVNFDVLGGRVQVSGNVESIPGYAEAVSETQSMCEKLAESESDPEPQSMATGCRLIPWFSSEYEYEEIEIKIMDQQFDGKITTSNDFTVTVSGDFKGVGGSVSFKFIKNTVYAATGRIGRYAPCELTKRVYAKVDCSGSGMAEREDGTCHYFLYNTTGHLNIAKEKLYWESLKVVHESSESLVDVSGGASIGPISVN